MKSESPMPTGARNVARCFSHAKKREARMIARARAVRSAQGREEITRGGTGRLTEHEDREHEQRSEEHLEEQRLGGAHPGSDLGLHSERSREKDRDERWGGDCSERKCGER